MTRQFLQTPYFVFRFSFFAVASLQLVTRSVAAQTRSSEAASVSQTVDGTVLTVEYSRPQLRGRVPFGGVVRWDEKWTPGANWATTLEVSRDVQVEGQPLRKGKYSVWMIPREHEPWTVILHTDARRFHVQRPSDSGEALRVQVPVEEQPSVEVLTWSFPVVQPDGATLRMQWGATAVPLRVRVGGRE